MIDRDCEGQREVRLLPGGPPSVLQSHALHRPQVGQAGGGGADPIQDGLLGQVGQPHRRLIRLAEVQLAGAIQDRRSKTV